MTREERLEKQKQRLIEMKVPEEDLHEQGYRCIAGIDEVGRWLRRLWCFRRNLAYWE